MSTKKKTTKSTAPKDAAVKEQNTVTPASKAAPKTAKKKVPTQSDMDKAVGQAVGSALDAALSAAPEQAVPAGKPQEAQPALEHAQVTPPANGTGAAVAVHEAAQVPAEHKPAAAPAVKEPVAPPMKREAASTSVPAGGAAAAAFGDRPKPSGNPYLPEIATVVDVIDETHNIKTLRVVFDNAEKMRAFTFQPGQVGQLSVFGVGESTFVINSPPSRKEYLQFSVMRAGEATTAIHKLAPGDKVGVRAPLGNSFPYEQWKGKNIVFVGGGIGMAPIRTIMLHLLDNRADYGKINLLYGARSPRDMAFSYELDGWMRREDLDCTLTIDAPFEGWEHKVGLIPHILLELAPQPENTVAVLCGPPIMIKFTVEALKKLNFPDESIITTLEKRMKCGIGICGRCNIGDKYVCVDGPVFSWAELKELPPEL